MFGLSDEKRLLNERRKVVETFRKALSRPSDFHVTHDEGNLKCASTRCVFEFSFERRSSDNHILFVHPPGSPNSKMHFYLLRLMLGAKGDGGTSSASYALIANRYLQPLLAGDFSIHGTYNYLETIILDGLEAARRLDDSSPVRRKLAEFDTSWLTDIAVPPRLK